MPNKAIQRRQAAARALGNTREELKLFHQQRLFVRDTSPSVAAITGIGGAKTRSAALKVAQALTAYPGMRALVTAPTFDQLNNGPLRTLFDTIDPRLVIDHNRNDHIVLLHGDREIHYRSTDIPDNLRGPEYGIGWMDEAAFSVREAKMIFIGRIRQPGMPCQKIYTTTPAGINWVYEDFELREGVSYEDVATGDLSRMRIFGDGVTAHTWPSKANPHIPRDLLREWEREYGDTDFAQQELLGKFVRFRGLVYLVPRGVLVDHLPPRSTWKRVYGAVDFGSTSAYAHATAGVVMIEDTAGRFWVVEEFWARPVKPGQLEEWMTEMSMLYGVSYWEGDRSQFHAIGLMQQAGLPIYPTPHHSDISVQDGIAIVQRRLGRGDGHTGMHIVEAKCQHLCAELRTYQWEDPKPGQVPRAIPKPINNDAIDAWRYCTTALDRAHSAPDMSEPLGIDWQGTGQAREIDAILKGEVWEYEHDDEDLYFSDDNRPFAIPRAG